MAKQRYVYIVSYDGHIKEVHTRARTARERHEQLQLQHITETLPFDENFADNYGSYMQLYNHEMSLWTLERWPLGKPQ